MLLTAWFAAGVAAVSIRAQEKEDTLPQLAALLDAEPLALIACRNAREVPEKFAATTLSKMINDPQYERGEQYIEARITELLGTSPRGVWTEFEKAISGPIVLAILPGTPQTPNDKNPPLRVVLLVQVNEPDVGMVVKQQWPIVSSMVNSLTRSLMPTVQANAVVEAGALTFLPAELRTVATSELPTSAKLPEWVTRAAWPKGDILVRARPVALCASSRGGSKPSGPAAEKEVRSTGSIIDFIEGSGLESFAWGVGFNGELISERLVVDVADEESAFKKFSGAIRDSATISSWEGLMSATPGDVDAVVLCQSDLPKLGDDLPHLFEAVERYLRGKRWTKAFGLRPEALSPERFAFLAKRMQGSFGIVAKPAITGELRLIVTSSIKTKPLEEKPDPADPYKGNDTEKFRDELLKGLESTGGKFETLIGARKIGGALPLAAAFHGRGQFAAPVIGLSPGWAWLCSSSVAYQELTDAFKAGKTLAAREKKRAATVVAANAAPGTAPEQVAAPAPALAPNDWSTQDALRAEVNLDRVLKIGYAAWLLGNNEGPMIGNRKVPNELLPPPQVLGRALGKMRASANRSGNRLEFRSSCAFPGITLGTLAMLQDASETITTGRRLAADAAAMKKTDPAADEDADVPDTKSGVKPAKPDPEKQPKSGKASSAKEPK